MKIEVAKPDLEAALSIVSMGTPAAKGDADLAGHFVFRQNENSVLEILKSTNRVGCSMPLAGGQCEGNGEFTVEAWRLNKWIGAVQNSVLTLESEGGVVSASTPRGSVKFNSVDPGDFPFWDSTLQEAGSGVQVKAKRLHAALAHMKLFISDKDTTNPKLAVTEMRNGTMSSTDKCAVAVVNLSDLAESSIRIHARDLGSVLNFLSSCNDESVTLREHDRCLFLVREDGGLLTVGRPQHAFPDIQLDESPNSPCTWKLKTEDVTSAIGALVASASKEDTKISFRKDGPMIHASMQSAFGSRSTLHLEALECTSEDAEDTTVQGFDISYPYLLRVLKQWQGEEITFGIHTVVDEESGDIKNGYVKLREERNGDLFTLLLVSWSN